jgi:leader peptidase (prepilin peptidase) / N-methyltransferase
VLPLTILIMTNMDMIMLTNPTIWLIIIGIFGLVCGSFINVVIYRMPIMLRNSWEKECADFLNQTMPQPTTHFNLLVPRSQCPTCKTPIPFWHNIPLLSYSLLRGKCYKCKTKISWRYPLVEMLSCLAAIFIAYKFGITWQTAALLILTFALLSLIFIDLDWQLLPDEILLPLLWLGLLVNTKELFITPTDAIVGATVGYLSLWTIALLFKLVRKIDGMGHGDFKLLALFGAWFGWQSLPILLLIAAFFGSCIGLTIILRHHKSLQTKIPFGPFIAISGWLMIFWGQEIYHVVASIIN